MSSRCLICGNVNPCGEHSQDAQAAEFDRNCGAIRRLQSDFDAAERAADRARKDDLLMYGTCFEVDGERISPERVRIHTARHGDWRADGEDQLLAKAREIVDRRYWGKTQSDALAKRYYDTALDCVVEALTMYGPHHWE